MSGVSVATMGVQAGEEAKKTLTPEQQKEHGGAPAPMGSMTMMGSLRIIEIQLVAFVLVFSASGLVPLLDLLFPPLISLYLLLLSRFAFPSYGSGWAQPIFHGSTLFQAYVVVGTVVGLFLPLAYVLGAFGRGDELGVHSASPHLFLLSFQILTENIISGLSLFSPPVRALVPLAYTVRRIFVDINWIRDVWISKTLPPDFILRMRHGFGSGGFWRWLIWFISPSICVCF